MKIAVLVYALDSIGGIAKHVLYLSRELVAMGHEVDIWAVEYDPERCYPELAAGLNIHALRRPTKTITQESYNVSSGGRMMVYMKSLVGYYRDQQALARLIPAGYDVINPHGNTIHWAAAEYKRRYG